MNARLDDGEERRVTARFTSAIGERWWLILLTAIVVGALTLGVSLLLPPRYSATVQLAYSQDQAQLVSQALSSAGTGGAGHNVANDALALQTPAFSARVSQALGGLVSAAELRSSVAVSSNRELDLIEVSASGSDAGLVADIANTYAAEFVKQRKEDSDELLTHAQQLLRSHIDAMSDTEAASAYGVALIQRYEDLGVLISLDMQDYKIIQRAAAPSSAYFPRPFFNMLIGLVAGLMIGLLVVLAVGRFDRRIKDETTLERIMELPVIGAIPQVAGLRDKSKIGPQSVGFRNGNDALLESMRVLRSNLKALGFGESKRSLLLTSVGPSSDKSALAINLALAMALAGDPVIHQYLGIVNSEGLADAMIQRDESWSAKLRAVDLGIFVSPELTATRNVTGKEPMVSKFLCLTSGRVNADATQVLEPEGLMDIMSDLQGISDYVIVDGPPVLEGSDSLTLAGSVDGLVITSTLGRDTAEDAAEVREVLARAEIGPLGVVMCGAKKQSRESLHQALPVTPDGSRAHYKPEDHPHRDRNRG
jgi:capsular polysaccharide biosynthesis protein/Mrp family chromosome partitioning ATPase